MELITVTEYYGNSFVSERLAYYIGPGQIEYLPAEEIEEENGGLEDGR